eukprot:TRINITY_DN5030_c0_g2_i14.p1 TRINITY_DN5030_c0_g2~~TRINITY_DN5030_c0_g2_i14.p1  ORF type:complete len:180 (-),score=34.02 TRINITY_DN5030_c0_g2_i14:67-606(-)
MSMEETKGPSRSMSFSPSDAPECCQCKQKSMSCVTCVCNRTFCLQCIEDKTMAPLESNWTCSFCRSASNTRQTAFKSPKEILFAKEWRPTAYLSEEPVYNGLKQYCETPSAIKASPDSAFTPVRKPLVSSQTGKLPPISVFLATAEQARKAKEGASKGLGSGPAAYEVPSLGGTYLGTL